MWTGRLVEQLRVRRRTRWRWKPPCIPIATRHRAPAFAAAGRRPARRRSQVSRRRREAQSRSRGLGNIPKRMRRTKCRAGAGGLTLDAPARRHALLGAGGRRIASSTSPTPAAHCVPPHRARLDAAHLASRVLRSRRRQRAAGCGSRARSRREGLGRHSGRSGGVVDFTGSSDPRAHELERRIVLSQYLTALNSAGHRAAAGRGTVLQQLERQVPSRDACLACGALRGVGPARAARAQHAVVSRRISPAAKARARAHGVRGAWWPKMVGPEGRESPSTVNPFIMWQQPHPIYLAEVLYKRAAPTRATLEKYREIVFETAELLASWPFYDRKAAALRAGSADDPRAGEFRPAGHLQSHLRARVLALRSRDRAGMARAAGLPKDPKWDDVLFRLSKLPEKDGLYLAAESQPDLWERARSPQCSKGKRPRMSEPRSPVVRRRARTAARLGRGPRDHAPHARCRARVTGTCARPGAGTGPCWP